MSRPNPSQWPRTRRAVIAPIAIFIAASAVPAESQEAGPPTFARDIAPILQVNCQECHQPGSIGPMSLLTYEEVRPWAEVIRLQVETREMPPYHYDTDVGIQELKHDKRLSAETIATISRWVEAGAPLGNPADLPPPAEWPDESAYRLAAELGPPDLVIRSDPYTVPANGQDLWWRPKTPTGLTEDRCIRAIETKPSVGARAVTHHANSTFQTRDENGQFRTVSRLSEYALGKLGEIVPEGTCRIAPANSYVDWDIHYFPTGEVYQDNQVEVALWLHPEDYQAKYRQSLSLYSLTNTISGDLDIPPHGKLVTQGFHTFDTPVRIDSFQPHGHLRMVAASLEILDPNTGRRELVSMISNWNPGWHLSHIYEDHVAPLMPKGAVMILTAWYDNTADNPHNPDPDARVGAGNRAADEMAHAWIAVTHLDEDGYQQLLAEREGRPWPSAAEGQ